MHRYTLVILILLFPVLASAHEDHCEAGLGDLFFELPEKGFFIRPMDGRSDSASFVLLPDGRHYQLNSEFWKAAESIVDLADTIGPQNPVKSSVLSRLRNMARSKFWMDLSVNGSETFLRYGPLTFVMIATAEILEHTLLPGPPICLAVQAGCVLWSQQLREIWSAARYRYPMDQNIFSRLRISARIIRARFQFWRAMRLVFSEANGRSLTSKYLFNKYLAPGSSMENLVASSPFWSVLLNSPSGQGATGDGIQGCDHNHQIGFACNYNSKSGPFKAEAMDNSPIDMTPFLTPLDEKLAPMTRLFSAEEQLAFLGLQMRLAKQALDSTVSNQYFLSLKLRILMGKMGRALDRYGLILRQIAFSELAPGRKTPNEEMVKNFISSFFEFNSDLALFLKTVKRGLLPIGTVERNRLFSLPKELNRQLRVFQKKGQLPFIDVDCENALALSNEGPAESVSGRSRN